MTYDPERQRDGSRVFWADYLPDSAACPVLEDGETLRMHDGCRVTRRGDRVKWVEPAWLLMKLEAARLQRLDELEAEEREPDRACILSQALPKIG